MSNRQTVNVRIGNEKARNDLFGTEKAADQPGPGAYQSPDRKVKGFVMTGKQEHKISDTPGPGNYENNLKTKKDSPKYGFGSSTRDGQQTKKMNVPGPGAYRLKSHIGDVPDYALPNRSDA